MSAGADANGRTGSGASVVAAVSVSKPAPTITVAAHLKTAICNSRLARFRPNDGSIRLHRHNPDWNFP
jgi:hypothetical protein